MAIVNRKRISTSLDLEHYEFLIKTCNDNKQKQSVVIELALDLLNEKLNNSNLYDVMKTVDSIK